MGDSVSQSPVTTPSRGLTSEEARWRLLESGSNAVIEKKSHLAARRKRLSRAGGNR